MRIFIILCRFAPKPPCSIDHGCCDVLLSQRARRDSGLALVFLSLRSKTAMQHRSWFLPHAPVAAGSLLYFLSLRDNPPQCFYFGNFDQALVSHGSARKPASPFSCRFAPKPPCSIDHGYCDVLLSQRARFFISCRCATNRRSASALATSTRHSYRTARRDSGLAP